MNLANKSLEKFNPADQESAVNTGIIEKKRLDKEV
jgi:hypothetical protein